jgi:hypothetical protein
MFLQILMIDTGIVMRTNTLFGLCFDELKMFCFRSGDNLKPRIAGVNFSVPLRVHHIESVP